jgi:GntR family transcriptional regulator/GntR family frlABCD operon transcriptional regulator
MKQYQQIYDSLKDQILNDLYVYGDLLPSENDMCKQFNTTRLTIRQALAMLVNEGYITKHHGKGSVVTLKRNSLGLLSFKGFSEVLGSTNIPITNVMLSAPIKKAWDQHFFFQLNEEDKNKDCIFLNRLRMAQDDPVMLEYTYFRADFPDFCTIPLEDNSLFSTLRKRYKLEVVSAELEVRAKHADANTARLLEVHLNAPVIHIYGRYHTSNKNFFIYSSMFCNTDKYSLGNIFNQSYS